jgi:hypothetical protein
MNAACEAKQYQAIDGSKETLAKANQLNKSCGYPLVVLTGKGKYEEDFHRTMGEVEVKEAVAEMASAPKMNAQTPTGIGLEPLIPAKPEKRSPLSMNRYYRQNREAILADLDKLGQRATMQKWGMKRRALNALQITQEIQPRSSATRKDVPEAPRPRDPNNEKPIFTGIVKIALPPWNEAWADGVKEQWLRTYGELQSGR